MKPCANQDLVGRPIWGTCYSANRKNEHLATKDSCQYLGVYVNHCLNWTHYITIMANHASSTIHRISILRNLV